MSADGTLAPSDQKLVRHVGCGPPNPAKLYRRFRGPEWREIRFDISEDNQPDVVGDMLDMHAIASNSMDAVYSSHNIEHLHAHQVPVALKEFLRVLKPDGLVVLTCPDLGAVATVILEGGPTTTAYESPSGPITPLDIIYGFGRAIARGNLFMAHKTGFTAQSLADAFAKAGFNRVRATTGDCFDLWLAAYKPG